MRAIGSATTAETWRSSVRDRIICMITDRGRLARSLGLPIEQAPDLVIEQVRGAVLGGVDCIQIREKDLGGRALADLVRRAVHAARGSHTRILVNDRVDVALAVGAHGVHVPEDGVSGPAARALLRPGMWLGRSVHSAQGARGAVGIDYLVGGSVFETESKPGSSRTLGQDGLRDIVLAAGDVPVWAIGGVRAEHLPSLAASGVRGVAVIGALIPVEGRESITKEVARRASELRFAFDTSAGVP